MEDFGLKYSKERKTICEIKKDHIINIILHPEELPAYKDALWLIKYLDKNTSEFCKTHRIYQIWNEEFVQRLESFLEHLYRSSSKRPIVEIYARDGKLTRQIRKKGLPVVGIDSFYENDVVEKMDILEGIDMYKPEIIIGSWPELDIAFKCFNYPSVKYFILIGEKYNRSSEVYKKPRQKLKRPSRYALCWKDYKDCVYHSCVELFTK